MDLPTAHRYLGRLDNVMGYTFYDDGEEVTLPALKTNTIVFPGYNLPLVINENQDIEILHPLTMNKNVFVLLIPRYVAYFKNCLLQLQMSHICPTPTKQTQGLEFKFYK